MDRFKNAYDSHQHSLETLNLLYEYDDFMDNLTVIADMGCGAGLDSEWWATLMDRDDDPKPHNYTVYAVDHNTSIIEPSVLSANPNIITVNGDFEYATLPKSVDLMWCHDAFQYALNPLATLGHWSKMMTVNGMLIISVPQFQGYQYNRMVTRSMSGCYYNHNVVSLMYMLAVNGFDCRDCFFVKNANNSWMTAAVYKSHLMPFNYATTSWHDLAEHDLISDSAILSLSRYGHVRQEDLITRWLDKDFYLVKD
jgi:trans-aconitate methyltransferase